MSRRELIDVALGKAEPDMVIKDGKIVDVCTKEIYKADILIKNGRIAYVGKSNVEGSHAKVIDAKGKHVTPGLIETHLHSYETHLNMVEFAKALLSRGTTATPEAFYGMGVVSGMKGIKFCMEELKRTPLRVLFLVPVLAYLQNRELGLPPQPGSISAQNLSEMLGWPECLGLEEPPPLPIIEKDRVMLELFEETLKKGKIIAGHACGFRDKEIAAYSLMGGASDHECTSAEEAVEKARLGLRISMREGSGANDVHELAKAITKCKVDSRRFLFCADIISPLKIKEEGHLDNNIRLAISAGVHPLDAVQMATINAAEFFRVDHEMGSIHPGKYADLLIVNDLSSFAIEKVFVGGHLVVDGGKFLPELASSRYPEEIYHTVRLPEGFALEDLGVKAQGTVARVRIMGMKDGSLLSDERFGELPVKNGFVQPDVARDIIKIVMIDRYTGTKRIGKAFVQGYHLRKGAIGSTYNPVAQNIVIVGTNDEDIGVAADELVKAGGGFIAVSNGKKTAMLELPLFGLLSDRGFDDAVERLRELHAVVREMGCMLSEPFYTLAFSCVAGEIGKLKICDQGLFDVDLARLVDVVL
jgi:adenine deaminase